MAARSNWGQAPFAHFAKTCKRGLTPIVSFSAAGIFHWAAAAGVSLFAVVDGAYYCYYDQAGYSDYGDY